MLLKLELKVARGSEEALENALLFVWRSVIRGIGSHYIGVLTHDGGKHKVILPRAGGGREN